jgi:hypothetical protein
MGKTDQSYERTIKIMGLKQDIRNASVKHHLDRWRRFGWEKKSYEDAGLLQASTLILTKRNKPSRFDELYWTFTIYWPFVIAWLAIGAIGIVTSLLTPPLGFVLMICFYIGPFVLTYYEWKKGIAERRIALAFVWAIALITVGGLVKIVRENEKNRVAEQLAKSKKQDRKEFIGYSAPQIISSLHPIVFPDPQSYFRSSVYGTLVGYSPEKLSWATIEGFQQKVTKVEIYLRQNYDDETNKQQLKIAHQLMSLIGKTDWFNAVLSRHEWGENEKKYSTSINGGFGLVEFSPKGVSREIKISLGKENYQIDSLISNVENLKKEQLTTYIELINLDVSRARLVSGVGLKKVDAYTGKGELEVEVEGGLWTKMTTEKKMVAIRDFQMLWAEAIEAPDHQGIFVRVISNTGWPIGGIRDDNKVWVDVSPENLKANDDSKTNSDN